MTWTKYSGYVVTYEWEEYNEENGTWQQRKQWIFKDCALAMQKAVELLGEIKEKALE